MRVTGPWGMRWFYIFLTVGIGGYGVVNLLFPRTSFDTALAAVQLGFAAFWGALAALPQMAEIGDDAITVRNRWRRQRVEYADIRAVDVLSMAHRGIPILRLDDGVSVRIHAGVATRAHPGRAQEVAAAVRAHLVIPPGAPEKPSAAGT